MLSGYIKIDKEEKFTSSDVDNIVKKRLNTKKVGHNGTLDPFATGLLIIGVNDATKSFTLLEEDEKEYVASLKLGATTSTLDKDSEIIEEKEVPDLTSETIKEKLDTFLGEQEQVPPIYSARHVNGVHAYTLARLGVDFSLPATKINIKEIELLNFDKENNIITFKAVVSKGTYIRVLGADIAKRLNTIGYLLSLRRTRIGSITLENSVKVKEVTENDLIPVFEFYKHIPHLICDEELAFRIKNGQTIKGLNYTSTFLIMIDQSNNTLAIYKKDNHVYRCYKGFRHD